MERLKIKREKLLSALERLEESVEDFEKIQKLTDEDFKELSGRFDFLEKENIYRSRRDSMVQRFEFSSDLFWKYLKLFMTESLKRTIELNAPKSIIRDAHNTKLITEEDARELIKMINDRNLSSHIYKEEVADEVASKIPTYYKIMKKYAEVLVA